MSVTDEELDRMLRAADPARTPRDAPLTMRELAIMERIMATPYRRPRLLRAGWARLLVPVAALAVVVLAVVLVLSPSAPAVAFGPRPLEFADADQSVQEVLRMAVDRLDPDPGAEPVRGAVSTGWYLNIDHGAHDKPNIVISPQIDTVTWAEDLSGRVTQVAAESYWADGSPGAVLADQAPEPGTVLSDMTFPAGTFHPAAEQTPPTDAAGMAAWLDTVRGIPDATAADVIAAIDSAMTTWSLTDLQHALMLTVLLNRPGVEVLGTTTDRAGRTAIGVAADSQTSPGNRAILLISTDTGRIIGAETTRTTPVDGVPAGTITSYTLWSTP